MQYKYVILNSSRKQIQFKIKAPQNMVMPDLQYLNIRVYCDINIITIPSLEQKFIGKQNTYSLLNAVK